MVRERYRWQLTVHGYGSIKFTALVDGAKWTALVETVLYVPDLGVNLFSIVAITEVGVTVHFIESPVSFKKLLNCGGWRAHWKNALLR
jgi:hypothetical protein